jgi:hypothetical protein
MNKKNNQHNQNNTKVYALPVRVIVWCMAAVAIYQVVSTPLRTSHPVDPYDRCEPQRLTQAVSEQEFTAFLKTWNRYIDSGMYEKASLGNEDTLPDPSLRLPWIVRFWLFKNCWDADRFYYVNQRLRQAVKDSETLEHSAGAVALLEQLLAEIEKKDQKPYVPNKRGHRVIPNDKEIENVKDENVMAQAYKQMINDHKKAMANIQSTEDERRFATAHADLIKEIFDRTGTMPRTTSTKRGNR